MKNGNRSDRRRQARDNELPAKRKPPKTDPRDRQKPSLRELWHGYTQALESKQWGDTIRAMARIATHPKILPFMALYLASVLVVTFWLI